MSEFFDRTGPLQEAGSYPQWAQQLIVDCQASKDRVSGHELYRRMRDAELSPALMRLYLIGGWPVVEQFPLYMSQNLLKTRFARHPGEDMARRWLMRNIRVELNHADYWLHWAEAHGVSLAEIQAQDVPAELHALSHWCWHTCASDSLAMLTTFNEVNMKPIMDLRSKYKDLFEKKHNGVRLGFMSFFVKAATEALKRFPGVNASIDGNDIVYHGYQDIGVAVSSDRGLVVPVLRNAEFMSLAEIEGGIANFGKKAKEGKLTIEDMTGGTFTISNGGVFGSLLSTPIVNPPQTAILGMHKIQERPMAVNGQVVILPMMYLALSYDHRLIDGKEAVSFLVAIKDLLEDPARLLLDV